MSALDQEVTADDLAGLFRVSRRRIEQLAQQGTLTRVARNRYRLQDAVHAMLDEMEDREGPSALQAARLAKLEAEAGLARLQLLKARGLVAPVQQYVDAQMRFTGMVQHGLMQLPQRLAIRLLHETDESRFKATVRDEVTAVLTASSADIQRVIQQMRDGQPTTEQDHHE